jgi:glycosyltransferase involved in cell wall biosynthesis
MSAPAVSVIIPAYNAAHHIVESLASVQQQTLKDVEVIVVDDGSKDATVATVAPFASSLDLVLIEQANAGAAAARNVGILHARSRYCAFLDADDVMLPERLELQVRLLDEQPDVALVHTDLVTFNEQGTVHHTRRVFSNPLGGSGVLEGLLLDNFITTSTATGRTDKLIEAGMFPPRWRISHDFELWLRMAAKWPVAYIDRPLLRYRYSPGSLSNNRLKTAIDAFGVIRAFWDEHPDYRAAHPALYRRSLGIHLSTLGYTSLGAGNRRDALRYLLRSLRLAPRELATWKALAKTVLNVRQT